VSDGNGLRRRWTFLQECLQESMEAIRPLVRGSKEEMRSASSSKMSTGGHGLSDGPGLCVLQAAETAGI